MEYTPLILGIISFVASFLIPYLTLPKLIRKLKAIGITGKDINKPDKQEVAEMGGIAIVMGLCGSILIFTGIITYVNEIFGMPLNLIDIIDGKNLTLIFASLSTILVIAIIGILDDLFDLRHSVKAVVPIFASLPLVAIASVGSPVLNIPFIGETNFGILYALILVPIAITACSNMTNMLAGFNGMEAGMGIIMSLSLAIIALLVGTPEGLIAFILLISLAGALLGFLKYNWFPAKVFPGDVGNLTIGAVIATAVIIGNFESYGVIVMLPFIIEFFIKLINKLPTKNWQGKYINGKLYPLNEKPVGFAQWIMYLSKGISEKNLTMAFIGIELIFCITALLIFFIPNLHNL
ncbi:MAG: hypothetical protein GW779_04400 [Candidatus Altiarchaeum hamiconexum]|uniref:UDP-N-acetylglucosamine--dolichyl-phosphate N-acetylglucosaminephosphotransferase n=1 Tax=Candidatus Altarchaeum hamiconexum TaxID=1803513 RepID=A0A8J7YZ51_9ARCH|nr:hypothetical protein [Candidatus Altarchaeum hamiconexum]OIQ05098.1 MAG: hypothetical protein AUK59_05190 [Candidatus Altarchaeum sp. CG2_30_32_3053]PIN67815.1 MAG: hypothetical protein COV98_01435 [Candidatus Altarchaeum sp. CG12_big_fil_rev_8_21_14_0_65_33_22]PIV27488.1 MAG: hypothetical protein COS36_05515 [Candidatus Altarchaeum sp. CG03_land_8_20_14_0_80_32_618]PIX48175.1 MAG: hypothetical protein COZ53_04870 [Candidatus Altarchaeum sp. CG_4_8_14_3_um_filter_33_2054]PIZ29717.1 MAG: hyp